MLLSVPRFLSVYLIFCFCLIATKSFAQQRFFEKFYLSDSQKFIFFESGNERLTLFLGNEIVDYFEKKDIRHTVKLDLNNNTFQIFLEDFDDLKVVTIGKVARIPDVQIFAKAYGIEEYEDLYYSAESQSVKILNFGVLSSDFNFQLYSNLSKNSCTEFRACGSSIKVSVEEVLRPFGNIVERIFDVDEFISTEHILSTRRSRFVDFILSRTRPSSDLFKEVEFLQNCEEDSSLFERSFSPFGVEHVYVYEKKGPSFEFLTKVLGAKSMKSLDLNFRRFETNLSDFAKLKLHLFFSSIDIGVEKPPKRVELEDWYEMDSNVGGLYLTTERRMNIAEFFSKFGVEAMAATRTVRDCYYKHWRDFGKVSINVK